MSDKFKPGDKVRAKNGAFEYGLIIGYGSDGTCWCELKGAWKCTVIDPRYYELIPEPRKIEGWVIVYASGYSPIYSSRGDAENDPFYGTRIACIYVSGTEGVEP